MLLHPDTYETFDWKRGDSLGIQVEFPGADLTGATAVKFTAKAVPDDAVNDAAAAIVEDYASGDIATISDDPTSGICVVYLSAAKMNVAPKRYYCDVEAVLADGKVVSTPTFVINLVRDMTRR
jgi:hypothetical protein